MQIAVGVGRRHDDSVRSGIALPCCGRESIRRFPEGINIWLVLIGLIGFTKFHIIYYSIGIAEGAVAVCDKKMLLILQELLMVGERVA